MSKHNPATRGFCGQKLQFSQKNDIFPAFGSYPGGCPGIAEKCSKTAIFRRARTAPGVFPVSALWSFFFRQVSNFFAQKMVPKRAPFQNSMVFTVGQRFCRRRACSRFWEKSRSGPARCSIFFAQKTSQNRGFGDSQQRPRRWPKTLQIA